MAILFSIIIPVYNSEKYLLSSVESVLKQSFSKKKYEIILINDCSIDKSTSIIKNLKRKFKTIKVINNKRNYKVSYCRNIGIKKSKPAKSFKAAFKSAGYVLGTKKRRWYKNHDYLSYCQELNQRQRQFLEIM